MVGFYTGSISAMAGIPVPMIRHTIRGWKRRHKAAKLPQFSLRKTSADLKTFCKTPSVKAPQCTPSSTALGNKSLLVDLGRLAMIA